MMRIGFTRYSYCLEKPITLLQLSNRINLVHLQMDNVKGKIKGRAKHSFRPSVEQQSQGSVQSSSVAQRQVKGRTASFEEFNMFSPTHMKIRTFTDAEAATNSQSSSKCESPKRTSLSIKTLQHPDNKGKAPTQSFMQEPKDEENRISLFNLDRGPPIFPLHVDEVKSARRKSWGFMQKTPESTVVMFPNPTFDQKSTDDVVLDSSAIVKAFNDADPISRWESSVSSSFSVRPVAVSQPSKSNISESTLPPATRPPETEAHPPESSKTFGEQVTPNRKRKISKVQRWLSVLDLTQTSSPIVIRKLPDFHEMQGITEGSEIPDDSTDQKSFSTSSDSVTSTKPRNSGNKEELYGTH